MRSYLALWVFIAIATAAAVRELTVGNFDAFVDSHELSLISFIAPWCSYCQDLAPEFEAAAKSLESEGLPLASVNCVEEPELCQKHQIPIYPTILLFRGSETVVYNGRRKEDPIASFWRRHNQPLITSLSSMLEVADFNTKDKITVVGYFDADDEASSSKFAMIAEKHRDSYLFGQVSNDVFGQAEDVEKPAIVFYKSFDEGKNIFRGVFDMEAIETFFEEHSLPLISEIGVDVAPFHAALSTDQPIAFVFAETKEERANLAMDLKPVAEATKGRLVWVTADPVAYAQRALKLALKPGEWPAFGIEDNANDFKFAFPQQGRIEDLNKEAVQMVVQDFLAGKLVSSIRSEPIPASQTGPIVTVVADTYNQLVTDNEKDILMLFYSPSCKHCKAMAPSYDEVGELLKPFEDQITVAKIDATTNDVWPPVDSYPTIKLFVSGSKNDSVVFAGNRTAHGLINFVRDNGSQGTASMLEDILENMGTKVLHDEL